MASIVIRNENCTLLPIGAAMERPVRIVQLDCELLPYRLIQEF